MKNTIHRYALLVASSSILAAFPASAANSLFAPGDLVLFFQQAGGTNTVYANLGGAHTFRGTASGAADGVNQINFLNLNTTLESAFGVGWASDPNVYAGLAAVYSTNSTNNTVTNGDASRTLYVSASRTGDGTIGEASSAGYTVNTDTGMSNGANGIFQMNNAFEVNYDALYVVSPTSISLIDDQNMIVAGIQQTAFNIFGGGVQQAGAVGSFGSFGAAGNVEYALDLYRIIAKSNATTQANGQIDGLVRQGTYEGTITVNSSGLVSFVAVPEPSSLALSGLAIGAFVFRRRRSA